MPAVLAPAKVLLTGATGFVALHTVTELLRSGYSVVGTTRTAAKGKALEKRFGPNFTHAVVDNIESPNAFDDVIKHGDFSAVIHMASPVTDGKVNDVQDLYRPAIEGSRNILLSIQRHGPSVKRVLWTGSMACVVNDSNPPKPVVLGEDSFNTSSPKIVEQHGVDSPGFELYRASKALAEQAVWEYVEANKSTIKYDVTAIHLPFIMGPVITDNKTLTIEELNGSTRVVVNLFTEKKAEGAKEAQWNYVHVYDVAKTHVAALSKGIDHKRVFSWGGKADFYKWKQWATQHGFKGIAPVGLPGHDLRITFDVTTATEVLGVKYLSEDEVLQSILENYSEHMPHIFTD